MLRTLEFFLLFAFALNASAKCLPPDYHKLTWTRSITPKSLPAGVEVFDRVWLKNPTTTEFITYTPEKGAEARTGYRKLLGSVPTTKDELPGTKLVNGERYEYHFPANPDYSGGAVQQAGWVRQDYQAGLVLPPTPILPPLLEERIFSGKTKAFAVKVPVPYYYGGKRGKIEFIFEFVKNARYGIIDPACPPAAEPTPTPSP